MRRKAREGKLKISFCKQIMKKKPGLICRHRKAHKDHLQEKIWKFYKNL